MKLSPVVVLILFVPLSFSWAAGFGHIAGQERRVTVVTTEGETLQGVFHGATSNELDLGIAGQSLKVALDKIRYISFVGELAASSTDIKTVSPVDDALAAFKEIQSATEIGLLRDQYAAKMQETLPRVAEYLKTTGDAYPDVQLSFQRAVLLYQTALDLQAWKNAATYWAAARAVVDFAKDCLKNDAPSHREDPTPKVITIGSAVNGRLGTGDRTMTDTMDKSSAGAFNDVYTFDLKAPGEVLITVLSMEFDPHITLLDSTGKKLEGDGGYAGRLTTKKKLNSTGTYTIWLGAMNAGHVGRYTMKLETP